MKIVIREAEYDLSEAVGEAFIGDLYVLKTKLGISVKTINKTFEKLNEELQREDFEQLDLLDDPDLMLNLQGMIWLAKRKAGEMISLHEAGNVPFNAVSFQGDEGDEAAESEPEIDPKALDSAAAGEAEAEAPAT